MATEIYASGNLFLKTYITQQGDQFLKSDAVIFYHPLDDFEEVTQDQIWQGSSSFIPGKIGQAGTSAAAAAAFDFTPNESGFSQVSQREIALCVLGEKTIFFSDMYGHVGRISGTSMTWGGVGPIISREYNIGLFTLSWDDISKTGYVCAYGSHTHSARGETVSLVQVDGGGLTSTIKDSFVANQSVGARYDSAKLTAMDMSGVTKPTGHILMGVGNQYCIITVSGDTLASGVTQYGESTSFLHDLIRIDDTHAVGLYQADEVRIFTIDPENDIITQGSGFTYDGLGVGGRGPNSLIWNSRLIHVSGNKFAIITQAGQFGNSLSICLGEVNGSEITFGTQISMYRDGWHHTYVTPSLLDDATIYIDYAYADLDNDKDYSYYNIAHVDGMQLSVSNDLTRYTYPNDYVGMFGPAIAISPSSIFAIQQAATIGDDAWVKFWALGVPEYGFSLVSSDEAEYPSASGATHLAWAMWTQNLTTVDTTFTSERDYKLTISPSSISLGSGTATWNSAEISGLLAVNNNGSDHLLVLDFEYSGSNDWQLRTSIDGSGWVDQGTQDVGSLAPVSETSAPGTSLLGATYDEWVDELIMWGGDFDRFTEGELERLYVLGDSGLTMGQYGEPMESTKTADLFLQGCGITSESVSLFIGGEVPTPSGGGRVIDWLLRSSDHNPQIIGTFTSATTVNIQVWDITDGQNDLVSVASSGCDQIGDTGRWRWSTSGLPATQGHARHYFYMMTSDVTDTFDGQFLMEAPEGAKWIHPDSQQEYLVD